MILGASAATQLGIALPVIFYAYLVWRREWERVGLYIALSFAISAWVKFDLIFSHLWGLTDPLRGSLDWAIIGGGLYLGGMMGAMRGPSPFRTLLIALAAMETLFVSIVPLYRFAFELDQGGYFYVNGTALPNSIGAILILLLAVLPTVIAIPWMLARQSASAKTMIAPALSRYGMLSGTGVVLFLILSSCFIAWGYIGYGPFSGIPQRPAFAIEQSMVGPNTVIGMLLGVVLFLFWIFPQRFFDPVVKLLEASQNVNHASLEEIAQPLWRGIARNLDDGRREAIETQKELNQTRSLLLSFFNTAPADMFVKTVEGQLIYCSPGLATVLGRTQEEMAGMFEAEYHAPEHLERIRRIDAKLVRDRKPLVAEIFNPALQRHELQTRFPIFNDNGDVTHIGGMFIDIDERVKAQQNQKKAEEWLEAFLRNAPFPISLVDPANDLFLKANAVGAEMYDMTPEELLARKPSDVVEEFWPRWDEDMLPAMRRVFASRQPQTVETLILRKRDGSYADYLISLFPISNDDSKSLLLALVGVDLSGIRKAEQEIAESQANLQAFFEYAPLQVYVTDLDHRIVMVNDWVYRETGAEVFRPENVVGLSADQMVPTSWADMSHDNDATVIDKGGVTQVEVRGQFGGKERDIISIRFPIKDADGNVIRVGGFVVDVTKQKEAERALAEQLSQTHQSEKLAALGQLLAGVAHELNNPLAIVLGRAAILKDKLADTPHADSIRKLRDAADRCARIVKTFLAMARQTGPRREAVQVNELIEGALDMTAYGLRNAQIELVQELDATLPVLEADEDQIVQLLINLIVNAQHALEGRDGIRTLTVRTRLDAVRRQAVIEVADNGPGVQANVAARIFEPFFTTKEVGDGTGLGLSVCKGLVEAHGGTLTLHETPGGGATFRATLPLLEVKGPVDQLDANVVQAASGQILIIDDEPEIAAILADCLAPLGLNCQIASDGHSALELIGKTGFDAIFCDVRMPGMDGIAFLDRLQADQPGLARRLAFVSGDVLHRDVARLQAASDRPIIEKPFDPQQVRDVALQLLASTGDHQ